MGHITLACGTVNSDRPSYMDALWDSCGNQAILLCPTLRSARLRQESRVRRCNSAGAWGTHAWEMTHFVQHLLEGNGLRIRRVSMLERQWMVRRVLEGVHLEKSLPSQEISPGLVRHLLHVITQLKQAAIEPSAFHAATAASAEPASLDGLVDAVYNGYQTLLLEDNRYDVPGLYWEAERYCLEHEVALPHQAKVMLADGFDDFTLSQQRFLVALSRHTEHLCIGLNYDADPDRRDLFHLQHEWANAFTQNIPVTLRVFPTHPPSRGRDYIAHHLFWRNPPPGPDFPCHDVQILPCADPPHEIESIGRRIKALLRQGVAPQCIAVALPDLEPHEETLRAILNGFGIPLTMRITPSLMNTAAGAFVLRFLDALTDWERQRITDVLMSPMLRISPEDEPCIDAFPLIARRANVLRGRASWEKALDLLESALAAGNGAGSRPMVPLQQALTLLRSRFNRIAAAADMLPESAPPRQQAAALDAVLDALGLEQAAAALPNSEEAQQEYEAVSVLRGLLQEIAGVARSSLPMKGTAFVHLLHEAMMDARLPALPGTCPGVVCCSLDQLRGESFEHVFIGGLNEGVFPRPAPINAVYADPDIRRLRKQGLPLPHRNEHAFRERLAFHHALCAAEQHLTLLWRKQDWDGRDLLPSPFLVDIEDMFSRHGMPLSEPGPGPDCFLPSWTAIASARDLANAVYFRNVPRLRSAFQELFAPLERRVAMETDRNSSAPFGCYDGCIQSPELLARLAASFGESAQFSANQVERYLAFPFDFFLERILRVEQTRLPEEDLDPLVRGSMVHDALLHFHRRHPGRSVAAIMREDAEGAAACMKKCVAEAVQRQRRRLAFMPEPLLKVEQRRLEQAMERYLARAPSDLGADYAPQYFEAVFGHAPLEEGDALFSEEPFALSIGGETFLFTGKIDRVDVQGDQVRLIDYKTSTTPEKGAILQGGSLQLTLYAWAVEQHLLPGSTCEEALYYALYANKKREALFRNKDEEFRLREEHTRARIVQAIHGIRSGQFPPVPAAVPSNRSFHPAARYEQGRMQRKCPAFAEEITEDGEDF